MWKFVVFMAGFVAFLILMFVVLLIVTNMNNFPAWIAGRFEGNATQDELEARVQTLENRLDRLEA